jgi:hypothetical protein
MAHHFAFGFGAPSPSCFTKRRIASPRFRFTSLSAVHASIAAVVKGIEPQDQMEAMLAAQMATIHTATIKSSRTLALDVKTAQARSSRGLRAR